MNETLLLSSTSLDHINQINNQSDSILKLAFDFLKPREYDQSELLHETNQFYNRISCFFSDSSYKMPCARSQFANLLRTTVKIIGLSPVMITKTVAELNSPDQSIMIGGFTVLAVLLHETYRGELSRISNLIEQTCKRFSSNPIAAAYCFLLFSHMPRISRIFDAVPSLLDNLLANIDHSICQDSVACSIQEMCRLHPEAVDKIFPRLIEMSSRQEDPERLKLLLVLCNNCNLKAGELQDISAKETTKAVLNMIKSIEFSTYWNTRDLTSVIEPIEELFANAFCWVLQREREPISMLVASDKELIVLNSLYQILVILGQHLNEKSVPVMQDFIFMLMRVVIQISKRRPV